MILDVSLNNDLVSAISSVNLTTATTDAATRLTAVTTNTTTNPTVVETATIPPLAVSDPRLAKLAKVSTESLSPATNLGVTQPIGYKFNLPPHDWSLPVRPGTVDPNLVGRVESASFHGLRRGRMWYWVGATGTTTNPSEGSAGRDVIDTAWGFQFLWNPTNVNTSVTRNMDITPSSADRLRVVAGVFPGQETVNLSILIDRTNDFACIRAAQEGELRDYTRYYNALYPGASVSQDMTQQITNLMAQGTMADLEYLFKAINGSGNGELEWTNLLGKRTANVGYLSPTLLGIQLGPTLNNLSYVGWVSNLSLNHTAFTENMVPIRTEVGISIQCFAGSGLTSGV